MRNPLLPAALALMLGPLAAAKVVDVQANGFEVTDTVEIKAPPAKVWATLTHVGAWWNPDHTYSGSARNLTLEPVVGGCFCEIWAEGSARHMTVVFVMTGKMLRLEGPLGPLQALGATGHLTWTLKSGPDSTIVEQTYIAGGYYPKGWQDMAPAVDRVLSEQAARLKAAAEAAP
jgi:Polyketide cyclase / dehydrase and lipid transport